MLAAVGLRTGRRVIRVLVETAATVATAPLVLRRAAAGRFFLVLDLPPPTSLADSDAAEDPPRFSPIPDRYGGDMSNSPAASAAQAAVGHGESPVSSSTSSITG